MKKRLLYISSIPLEKGTGSCLVMYRHLVETDDYKVLEINNDTILKYEKYSAAIQTAESFAKYYLNRTRFIVWFRHYNQLHRYKKPSKKLIQEIKSFAPDAILTVAYGNLFWLAHVTAQQLKLPLITVYHDWWPLLAKVHARVNQEVLQMISWRFKEVYKKSNCVFCVCPGMKAELGEHPNSHILYPIPDWKPPVLTKPSVNKKKFVLAYSGNMTSGYGLLLQDLIKSLDKEDGITLKLYGNFQDWPEDLISYGVKNDILHAFIPPEELRLELANADALIVTMGFEREKSLSLRTSFPSKLINYYAYSKPIFIWAPSESSVIKFSKTYDSGIVIEEPKPRVVIDSIKRLAASPERKKRLAVQSSVLYKTLFSPEEIHAIFSREVDKSLINYKWKNK